MKEEEKPEESENVDKELQKRSHEKQTKYVVIFMVVLMISVFAVFWYVQQEAKFTYNGIEFYRENEGSLVFYKSLLGYVTASGEEIPFILKLRTNPEELIEIPVKGNITLLKNVTITVSPEMTNCSDTYITLLDMSLTLTSFGMSTTGATTDLNYSIENNMTLADCRNSVNRSVIVFQEGNVTKITREPVLFKDCYIIEVKDCQIREGYERFILGYIVDGMINKNE